MADTLLSVAQAELAKADAEKTRAAAELTAAQNDLTQAQSDLAQATADLVALEDAGTAIQRQIAQTTIAAIGQQLFDDLDQNTTKVRSKQAAVAAAQERIAYATSRVGAAQDELAKAASAAAASTDAAAVAQKTDQDHSTWTTAATSPPLSNLPGASDVTIAGPAKAAADAAAGRLDGASGGDLPQELFQRAQERRQQALDRLQAIRSAATAAEDDEASAAAAGGLAGTAAQAQLHYTRSEAAVRDFALTGQERYDRAIALLGGVANATPLNTTEKARIATLLTDADNVNAFMLQKARDNAQANLDTANDAVDSAVLASLAADPSKDPSTDAGVQAAQAALVPLQQALAGAQAAFAGGPKDALDALEASVPADTWSLFDHYQQALALLGDLAAVNPATIATGLTNDEQAYAQALLDVQDNARAVLALGEVAKERDDRAGAAAQTAQSRLLLALRGDE